MVQYNEHQLIDNDQTRTIDPNKKVVILGLDGVPIEQFNESIITNDEIQQNHLNQYTFDIQGYESVRGWISVMFGNIMKQGKSIFENIDDAINGKDIKTALIYNWDKIENVVLNQKSFDLITEKFKSGVPMLSKDEIDDQQKYFNEVLGPYMQDNLDILLSLIGKSNLIFFYDTVADEAGHADFSYDDVITQESYKFYRKMITELKGSLKSLTSKVNNEYLILITTDHGRNKDGKGHSNFPLTTHKSWIVSNQDLEEILDRPVVNLYDIKTVVYNWMTSEV